MSKYDALGAFLRKQDKTLVPLTFDDIEKLVGLALPASSRYRAWWSNNPTNSVMTKVWLDAGFRSEQVDMAQGKVIFRRVENPPSEKPHSPSLSGEIAKRARHPLFGALKGLLRIAPGTDLTQPADPDWGKGN